VSCVPCFFWRQCRRAAALEKQGRAVCRECAATLRGLAYPLREPARAPLYADDWEVASALDMLEDEAAPTVDPDDT
jgi:hypothetical protein